MTRIVHNTLQVKPYLSPFDDAVRRPCDAARLTAAPLRVSQVASMTCVSLLMIGILVTNGSAADHSKASQQDAHAGSTSPASQAAEYVIGAEDVLAVDFWREKDISGEVIVRPDGKISLPLLNDIQAAGLTPDQLRSIILERSRRFLEDPNVTVIVKQINSRKVFITGEVEKPGVYPLKGATNVMQLIAMAGGLKEFADRSRICVMRSEPGQPTRCHAFNYRNALKGKNPAQNIELRPNDTVIVP